MSVTFSYSTFNMFIAFVLFSANLIEINVIYNFKQKVNSTFWNLDANLIM